MSSASLSAQEIRVVLIMKQIPNLGQDVFLLDRQFLYGLGRIAEVIARSIQEGLVRWFVFAPLKL